MGVDSEDKLNSLSQTLTAIQQDPNNAPQYLQKRIVDIKTANPNADTSDTEALLQQHLVNPQAAMQTTRTIAQLASDPKIRAYMARNPARAQQTLKSFGLVDANGVGMTQEAQDNKLAEMMFTEQYKKDLDYGKKVQEEERKIAADEVNKIKQLSYDANRGYKQVTNLINASKTSKDPSGRAINASAIVSIARMVSPEAVQEADVERLSGGGDVYQNALAIWKGNPEVLTALERSIDPLNKKYFNIDGLSEVADSAAQATYEANMNRLEDAKARARASGMPEKDFNTNFTEIKSLNEMGERLKKDKGSSVQSVPIITTKEQFEALPSGSIYKQKDGQEFKKP
jgi:hypothetical protein